MPSSRRIARLLVAAAPLILASGMAAAAPKAYVGNFADNTVSVLDTASDKIVATIPVAQGPHGMAMSRDGRAVYVTGDGSSSMSVIDTATDKVVKTVEVGKSPNGLALTPDGKLLLVTIYGEDKIDFIDPATQAITGTVAVPKPHTVSISPDGKLAYITSQEPGHFALSVVDIASRTLQRNVAAGLKNVRATRSSASDGKAFYFTESLPSARPKCLDPATDKIVAEIPTGVSPHFVSLFHSNPLGLAVVQGPGEVLLFDPGHQSGRTQHRGRQAAALASRQVAGDGKTAYVTNEGSN